MESITLKMGAYLVPSFRGIYFDAIWRDSGDVITLDVDVDDCPTIGTQTTTERGNLNDVCVDFLTLQYEDRRHHFRVYQNINAAGKWNVEFVESPEPATRRFGLYVQGDRFNGVHFTRKLAQVLRAIAGAPAEMEALTDDLRLMPYNVHQSFNLFRHIDFIARAIIMPETGNPARDLFKNIDALGPADATFLLSRIARIIDKHPEYIGDTDKYRQ